jgi:hypothetical protein
LISDEFFAWAQEAAALPKPAFGKAVHYAPKQKSYLERVFKEKTGFSPVFWLYLALLS